MTRRTRMETLRIEESAGDGSLFIMYPTVVTVIMRNVVNNYITRLYF